MYRIKFINKINFIRSILCQILWSLSEPKYYITILGNIEFCVTLKDDLHYILFVKYNSLRKSSKHDQEIANKWGLSRVSR